jgi:hypothetical protein
MGEVVDSIIESDGYADVLEQVPAIIERVKTTGNEERISVSCWNSYGQFFVLTKILAMLPPGLDITNRGVIFRIGQNESAFRNVPSKCTLRRLTLPLGISPISRLKMMFTNRGRRKLNQSNFLPTLRR